jgi:RNA polymerase sigma factor (sigma-70 family)
MRDYIKFPANVKELNELDSYHIKVLSKKSTVEGNKISLDFLRTLYQYDRTQFFKMVDELSLRGFKFHTEKPNSILPNYSPMISSYIVATENSDRYKSIDLNFFGLSGFLQRFNVKNDLFFHKIPLRGFKLLNARINVADLEEEFIKVGFEISGRQIASAPVIVKQQTVKNETSQNVNSLSYLYKIEQFILQTPVHIVFKGKEFVSFLNFCKEKEVIELVDVTSDLIKEFGHSYGIGLGKVQEVNEVIKEITHSSLQQLLDKFPNHNRSLRSNACNEAGDLMIEDVFVGNKFNRFLDFCKKKSIRQIGDIEQSHIDIFAGINGVGIKKVQEVVETLQNVVRSFLNKDHTGLQEDTDEGMKIKNVFQANKFITFRRFCHSKGIQYITDISEEYIDIFGKSRGIGVGKLNDVREKLSEINYSPSLGKFSITMELPDTRQVSYMPGMNISELFFENRFILFRQYCEESHVTSVIEINPAHLEAFSNRPGVGMKKVEDIKELLKTYSSSIQQFTVIEFKDSELYENIKNFKITDLLAASNGIVSADSLLTIEEINGMDLKELKEHFDVSQVLELQRKLKKAKNPETIVNQLANVLKENEYKILKYRYGEKLTLEETGKHFSVTRERVRQIAKKALKKVKMHLGRNYFYFVVSLFSSSRSIITKEELLAMIGKENEFLAEILKEDVNGFTYFIKLDAYFFTPGKKIKFDNIDDFMGDLPNFFYFNEYESALDEILKSIGIENPSIQMIKALIEDYGFKQYGEIFSRTKLSIIDILEILFRNFITVPFRIDEEGYAQIQELAKKHLNYEFSSSVRALDARIRDSDHILLVDRLTFQWFDSESFDQTIITKIDAYLKKRLKETNIINIEEVYNEFEADLQHLKINNKLHLYSIVRFYLDEDYIIGKGNTLNIFKNDADKINIEDSLLKTIQSFGGYCDKSQLQEILQWQPYKLDLGISSSKKLMSWGTNKVITFDHIGLTNRDKENLIQLTRRNIKEGFTTSGVLFREMKFDPNLASLISTKGIDDNGKLSSIIKILVPEINGHSNFLYEEGCKFTSFEEVIIDRFNSETSRKELQNFAIEFGYREVMAANILKKLLEHRSFVEIDVDKLYPESQMNIPDSVINELCHFVEEARAGKEYVSLSNLKGYKRRLPMIQFRWNPYLMKSILVTNGYRQITKIMSNYRYDNIILVKENSKITSFEELVHFVLKNEYNGNMHERMVYDFLADKGILREQESPYNKVLPYELKNFDNLVNVDDLGIVTLK